MPIASESSAAEQDESEGDKGGPYDGEFEIDDDADLFPDRNLERDLFDEEHDFDSFHLQRNGTDREEQVTLFAINTPLNKTLKEFEALAGLSDAALALLRNPALVDLHKLNKADRLIMAEAMLQLLCADGSDGSQSNMEQYKMAHAEESKYYARMDAETLKAAAVIGMTTTGDAFT